MRVAFLIYAANASLMSFLGHCLAHRKEKQTSSRVGLLDLSSGAAYEIASHSTKRSFLQSKTIKNHESCLLQTGHRLALVSMMFNAQQAVLLLSQHSKHLTVGTNYYLHLLLGKSKALFKNRFATSSFRWHNTLSTVLGSDRCHLPVVGGIGTRSIDLPSPLASHAMMLNSSTSFSVGRNISDTTPSDTAASFCTTSSDSSPSPLVQNTRFRFAKSSAIMSWSVLAKARPLPPANSTIKKASKEAFIISFTASGCARSVSTETRSDRFCFRIRRVGRMRASATLPTYRES
ncbi:hypothetical protein MUK42_37166 [Musa troglodytarum]|uniref:Secreted protein n=1 Tax=Musa troglodytarum TaxID=320322 RepID=A0A9E7J9G7_9LILI|nr:hypothetical protein MUK42_37166 [Musa troglodytarum]